MENALHRFVRLLRLRQVRISIPEALDAMAAPASRACSPTRPTSRPPCASR